jgi:hypothetical protein
MPITSLGCLNQPALHGNRQPRPITKLLQISRRARLTDKTAVTKVTREPLIEHPRLARLDLKRVTLYPGYLILTVSHLKIRNGI